jgi:hypothetical protein
MCVCAKWDGIQLVGDADSRAGGMRGLDGAIEGRGSQGMAVNTEGKGSPNDRSVC